MLLLTVLLGVYRLLLHRRPSDMDVDTEFELVGILIGERRAADASVAGGVPELAQREGELAAQRARADGGSCRQSVSLE
jgi:hypothetical protein